MNTEFTKTYADLDSSAFQSELSKTANAVILDVRTTEEFHSGRIPEAINIDVTNSTFLAKIESMDKSKTYFVYCRSGGRSGQACEILSARGFNVFNLAGGILRWTGKTIQGH